MTALTADFICADAVAFIGTATRRGIKIEQARAALAAITPIGAWAIVEGNVIAEQRAGADILDAIAVVHDDITSGRWRP